MLPGEQMSAACQTENLTFWTICNYEPTGDGGSPPPFVNNHQKRNKFINLKRICLVSQTWEEDYLIRDI